MFCHFFRMRTVVTTLSILLCISGTYAQQHRFAEKGITELSGSVAFSSITPVSNGKTGDAITLFSIGPQVGYFVEDGFEVGVSTGITLLPGLSVITPPEGDATTVVQLFFSPAYNFLLKDNNATPFIEMDLGYTSISSGNESQSGFSFGGKAGFKIPVVDHFLVSLSAQYLAITLNPNNATERTGFNYLTFGVGVGGYL
ncbi:MAG TPA: outer membrane beta-barrel protein [Bacteroidota bacterium]|nr:outer membrane beta-barrel protein [Bacteroidota bacterium]